MKEFNTTAVCIPSKHYMVGITERVKEIKKLVDAGKYFVINRGDVSMGRRQRRR